MYVPRHFKKKPFLCILYITVINVISIIILLPICHIACPPKIKKALGALTKLQVLCILSAFFIKKGF